MKKNYQDDDVKNYNKKAKTNRHSKMKAGYIKRNKATKRENAAIGSLATFMSRRCSNSTFMRKHTNTTNKNYRIYNYGELDCLLTIDYDRIYIGSTIINSYTKCYTYNTCIIKFLLLIDQNKLPKSQTVRPEASSYKQPI